MDFLTKDARSRRMSVIRKRDTMPEMVVRSMAHRLGYRFRLHVNSLPGTPDIVFPRLRKIVEVRGCFWHSHACRRSKRPVSSRVEYWHPKLARNVQRDRANLRRLRASGWQVLVVWECQLKRPEQLAARLSKFLDGARTNPR